MQKESENKTNIAITRQDMSLLKLSQLPMSSFGLLAVSFAQQILDRAQTNTAVSPMFSLDYLEEDSEAQQPKVEISPVLNLDLRFLLQQMQKMEDTRRQATVNAREQEIILQKITHTTQQNITQQNIQNTYQIRNTVNKQTVQEHSENNTTQVVQKPIENNNTQIVREHTENNTTQIVQKTVENNHTKTVREHTENNNTQVVQRPIENNNTQTVREYTANNSTQTVREHTANNTQIIREHTEDSSTQIIREHTENNTTQVVQRSIENNDTQVIRERVENNGIQAVRERTQGNNTQTVREHTENSDRIQIIRERETVQQSGRGTESDTEQSATGKTSAEKTAEISNFENVQTHIAIQAGARIDSEDHSKENKTDNMQYRGSDTAVIPQRAPQNDTALQYSRESAEAQSGRAVDRKTDENGTESTAETETADGAALVRQGDVYRLKPMTGEESTAYHLRRIIEKTASMQQQRQQRSNRAGAGMRLLGSEAAAAMTQTVESQQNNMTLLPPEAGGQELIFAQETQELDPVTQREKQIAQILHQVKSEMQNIAGEAHSAQADSTKSASAKAAPAFDKSASAASVPAFEKSVSAASTPASDKSSFAKAVSAKSDSAEVSSTEPGFAAPAENADQRGRAKKEEKVTTAKEDSTQASSFEEPRNELQRKELRTVYLPEKETRESRIPVGARKIGNAKRSENMMLPQLEMLFSNVLQAERSMGLTYGEAENRIPRAPQDRVEFLKKTTQNIIRREQLADAVNAIPAGILPTEELEFLRTITEGPGASGQLIRAAERVVYRTLQLTDRTWAIPEYARPTKQAQDEALARQADLKRELLILTEEQSAAPAVMQEVSAKTTVSVQQEDSAAIPDQEVLQRGRTEQKSVFEKIVQFLRGKENADTFAIEAKGHNAVEVRRALQETAPATVEMDYLSSAEEKQESEPTLSTPDGYADRAMQKESQSGTAMITAQQAAQAVSEIERRGSYEEHLEHEPLQIKYLNEENKKAEIKQRVDAAQKSEAVSREIPMAQLVQADAQLIRSLAYLSQLQDRQAGVEKIVLPVVQMGKTIYLTQPESGESATEYVTRLQKESGKTIRLTEPKTGESAKEYLTRIQKESGEMIYLTQPESGETAVEYMTRLQKESGKTIRVTEPKIGESAKEYLTRIQKESGEMIYLTQPESGETAVEYMTRLQKESGKVIRVTEPKTGESAKEYLTRIQKESGEMIYLMQPESGETAVEYVTRLQKESGKTIRLTESKTGESAKEYLTRIQKESGEMIYLTQPESGESAVEYVTRLQKESGKVIYVTRSERAQALQNTAIRTDSGSKADRVPATAAQQPVEIEYFSETANQPEHPQQAFRANPIMARRAEEKETVLQARAQTTQAAEQKRSSQPDSVSQPIEMSYVLQGSVEGQSEQQKTSPMQAEQLGQEQKFLKQQAKESSYYNSLPEWTKDFLENGYQGSQSDFRGTAEQTWESRAIPAKNVISWQNPNAEKLNSAMQPPQEIVLKQPEEKEPVEAYVSNSEIRRTADRVYKIIEERLRNERRRRGM